MIYSESSISLHTIHHHAHHHFLLLCPGLRNHDGQCHQRGVLDSFLSVAEQGLVFVKEVEKHGCGDAFVSVVEAVVLGHKVQQIRRFFLQRFVHIPAAVGLIDVADASFEGVVLFPSEQVRFVAEPHLPNGFHALLVGEHVDGFVALGAGQGLVVVGIQQI